MTPREKSGGHCWWLAVTGCLAAIVITALTLSGWRIGGNTLDWFPALVGWLVSFAFASLWGRLDGLCLSIATAVTVVLGLVAGHGLLWALGQSVAPESMVGTGLCYVAAVLLALVSGRLSGWFVKDPVAEPVAISNGVMWQQIVRHPRIAASLLVWIAMVGGVYTIGGFSDQTGFRMITVPHDGEIENMSMLGFSGVQNGRPVMVETIPAVEQVTWLSGVIRSDDNFRFLRAGHAFLATQFYVFTSARSSLLIVNVLAWLGCLAVVASMSAKYDGRWAVMASTGLAAVGIGFGIHINDSTPHMLAFFLYFVGVGVIDRLGFADEAKPWQSHLLFALIVGGSSLAYNVAQMLLFVYLAVGIWKQRWWYLGSVSLIALVFRPIWRWILPGLGINVREVEGEYLGMSIEFWKDSLSEGVGTLMGDIAYYLVESFSAMESPWVIALAMVSLLLSIRSKPSLLLAATLVAPVLACAVFAPTNYSRGYIVYSGSIALYLWIGLGFARLMRHPRIASAKLLSALASGTLLLLMFGGLFWATSHSRGWLGPAKLYFFGYHHALPVLTSGPPVMVDASGDQQVPAVLGGEGDFAAIAIPDEVKRNEIPVKSIALCLLGRFPFFAAIGLGIAASMNSLRRRRLWLGGLAFLMLLSTLVLFAKTDGSPEFVDPTGRISVRPGESLVYELKTSDMAREVLASSANVSAVSVYAGASEAIDLRWTVNGATVELSKSKPGVWRVKDASLLSDLPADSTWRFELRNSSDTDASVDGWQASAPRSRRSITPANPALPSVEIRVRDANNGALMSLIY